MPNKNNAKKALRQAKKRAIHNNTVKRLYKEAYKEAVKAIEAGNQDALELIKKAQKKLGKAAQKNVIKKGKADRKVSRLVKAFNKKTTKVS